MSKNILVVSFGCLTLFFSAVSSQDLNSLPENTWVRIAASPGDPEGREVPPGRAADWIYDPISGKMLRYGGYTPTYSNALYAFDLDSLKWTVLQPHDETYPTTRPGGGPNWSLMVDPSDRSILFCGGFGSTFYGTGDHGLWRYSSSTNTFTKISNRAPYPTLNRLVMAYDFKNRTIVSTLPMGAAEGSQGKTYVFPLDSNRWISKSTPNGQNPQESYRDGFPLVYDTVLHKILCFKSGATLMDVWAFDVTTSAWSLLSTTNAPPKRQWVVAEYDPLNKVTFMTGITDDKVSTGVKTDVWVFNSAELAWTRLTCTELPKMPGTSVYNTAVLYYQALAWNPRHKCMMLNDPDLGVWAFKYNPSASMGTGLVGFDSLVTGKAAKNTPAADDKNIMRTFAYSPNSRLADMADNSLLLLNGGYAGGNEIMWDYDPDRNILIKYGGCGYGNGIYWGGYGNQCDIYDLSAEKWYSRRTGDISGAARPGNGCTRSTIYDTNRKKWWFFGGTSGGPYSAAVAGVSGACNYDPDTDLFGYSNVSSGVSVGNVGCRLAYDPVNDIAVLPDSSVTYVYDFKTSRWISRAGGVGKSTYVYQRTVYVSSIGKMLYLRPTVVGTDSFMAVCLYDYANNQWTEQPRVPGPAFRGSKSGLAYDSINDIVLLVAGQVSWNNRPYSDMWAYHPTENRWEALTPAPVGGKKPSSEVMCTAYNPKDNVFIMSCNDNSTLFAYRYKNANLSSIKKAKSELEKKELCSAPNPFNPIVNIVLRSLEASSIVNYEIISLDGKCVVTKSVAGKMVWNAAGYPSGVYIVRAKFRDEILTRRIVLAK